MSNLLPVKLGIAPGAEVGELTGVVASIEVEGAICQSYLSGSAEVMLDMDWLVASRVLGVFALHHGHPTKEKEVLHHRLCPHNGLTFAAELLGTDPSIGTEVFVGEEGPLLIEGLHSVVADLQDLEPNKVYGVSNTRNRLTHAFLTTSVPDNILFVNGSTRVQGGGQMWLASIFNIVSNRIVRNGQLTQLRPNSYAPTSAFN